MSTRPARLAFAALVLLPAALLTLSAQQQASPQQQQPPPPQPPTFRTGVRLVRVDVTATGHGDEPVADLKTSDFEVTEDGIVQRIEQLQFLKLDGHTPRGDDRSLEIRTQDQAEAEAARDDVRVFSIFLDDYHIDKVPAITLPLRRALTKFVDRFWPTDLVALMDPLTPLSALRFTRSHAELVDVINRFEGRQGEIFPVKSAAEEAQLQRGDVLRVRAEVTLSALHALVVRLGGLREGRKVVIFVSQGPPTFFGRDGNLQDIMRDIAQAASRGNVSIYPVDPRGLGMVARGSRDTLFQLAAETGGRAITDTNDPSTGLGRILADTSAYYVLGYQPTRTEDDGKYHKINVKVKRSGVHVLARQGYWAPSAKELETARTEAARRPEPGVARALDSLAAMEPARRPADIWVGVTRGGDGRSRLVMTWDPSDAGTSVSSRATALDIELLDPQNGSPLEPRRSIPAVGATPAQRPSAEFSLKPGAVSLRITARGDADSVIGTWVIPYVVPDLGAGLALSTPRVYRAQSLAELRAINASPDTAPGATRRFARSDRVVVSLDCYAPAGAGAPSLDAELLARDGRVLAPLAVPALNAGRIRFELPLTSLGQGTYLVRVRAHLGEAAAEQILGFSIVR
jgi:VWFA-related protein